MTGMTWYEAAWYCNWLSEQEGISKEQWCYESNGPYGPGMRAKENFWRLTGYRLPTEAEWEYACRAGAKTSRFYGSTDRLLPEYAWYLANGGNHTWPVASLKPNDFGLFDMQGNAFEWAYDARSVYPSTSTDAAADEPGTNPVVERTYRVLRGGSFFMPTAYVRSALRWVGWPYLQSDQYGFRLAKTYKLSP
jgi:formylglycine-generating enzyme required for sulfatase activity